MKERSEMELLQTLARESRYSGVREEVMTYAEELLQEGLQQGLQEGLERYAAWIRSLGAVGESFGAAELRLRSAGVVREVDDA